MSAALAETYDDDDADDERFKELSARRRPTPGALASLVRGELASVAWWAGNAATVRLDGYRRYAFDDTPISYHVLWDQPEAVGLLNGAEDPPDDPRFDEECNGGYDEADGPPDPRRRRALYAGGHDLMDQPGGERLLFVALAQHMADVATQPLRHRERAQRNGARGGRVPAPSRSVKVRRSGCQAFGPDGRQCRKAGGAHETHSAGRGATYVAWRDGDEGSVPASAAPVAAPQRRTERPRRRSRRWASPPTPNRYAGPCARCHLTVPAGEGTYWSEAVGAPWRVTHVDQATCLENWRLSGEPLPAPTPPAVTLTLVPDRDPDRYTHYTEAWF